jgi:uncharacterized protein
VVRAVVGDRADGGRIGAVSDGPSGGLCDPAGAVASPDGVSPEDRAVVAAQLGRAPRAMRAVAHRCPCGLPDVVETSPRLPDGTPFPTLYYLTCPKASAAVGRLEAAGVMRGMADRLRSDPELARRYRAAHEAYLARRRELGDVPEIDGVSAGGMPTRVKCLHALLGHALAAGPGVNPLGDEVRDAVGAWWDGGPCVPPGGPA